jgi:4-amino-4-deoxy-L-arabinose transferase-like glycosyltransferase
MANYPISAEYAERWGLRLALVLAALTLWRLASLAWSGLDLYFDEAQYWAWAQEPAFGYFSKPPLLAWLIGATTGLCGDGEACVRISSPLLHALSAILVYAIATQLYDRRIGFWSAIVYATTPGIAFSSALISTDVPLLFFWLAALAAWISLQQGRSWTAAVALGLALGFGLLSKYAMIYFVLCAAIWMAFDRPSRWLLRNWRLGLVLAIAAVIMAPNIAWNIDNGLVTFTHTADNANWRGSLFHPEKALEFFGAQFGVFGPILFGSLLSVAWIALRQGAERHDRMLLAFSLPVLALIVTQAFLSRAHANWGATAYPAATILVTAAMLRDGWHRMFRFSLGLHLAVQVILSAALAGASSIALPGRIDPFWRSLGWSATADAIRDELARGNYAAILTDHRHMTAEMLYYLRDLDLPILAWRAGDVPRDHFELTRPYLPSSPQPVLLATPHAARPDIERHFRLIVSRGTISVAAGAKAVRTTNFYALDDYQSHGED